MGTPGNTLPLSTTFSQKDSVVVNRGEDGATPGAGDPRRIQLETMVRVKSPPSATPRYVRTPPVTVTFTLGSPGQINWTAHGLSVNDPVTFSLPRDKGTITLTIATPGVGTKVGHGLANDDPLMLSTTGAVPTGLSLGNYFGGTTLYARNVAADTLEFATAPGGASLATSGSQSGTHRLMRNSSMPAGLTNGTVYYVKTVLDANTITVSATVGGAAINLTGAAATGKVRGQTGNDNNDGTANDRAHAWMSFERALNYVNDDIGKQSFSQQVYFAEGDYPKGNTFSRSGNSVALVNFNGVQTAAFNGNCVLYGSFPIYCEKKAHIALDNWTVNGQGGFSFAFYAVEQSFIEYSSCELVVANGSFVVAENNSRIACYTDTWIVSDGSFFNLYSASTWSQVYAGNNGRKVYIETTSAGAAAAAGTATVSVNSYGWFWCYPTFEGTLTGPRFVVQQYGLITTPSSASLSGIPGSVAGTVDETSAYYANVAYNIVTNIPIVAFSGLPALAPEGARAVITDSNTAVWGATIAGGGGNRVEGRYNGTNWTVTGL